MKRLLPILISGLILVGCHQKQEKLLPKEQTLVESVYASVTIQPDSLYRVYSIVSGILDRNLVKEGARVQKDQILAEIINTTPKINSDNAKLAWQLAQENYNGSSAVLKGISDEIKAAELTFKNDSINFFRQQNLWNQKIGSKATYDAKKLSYELSANRLKVLQNKYTNTKNELKTAVAQSQNNYRSTLVNTNDFSVKSKMNGKVYALFKEPGEIVTTAEPIASVGSANRFNIELLVDEQDIVKVAVGQVVLVSLEAYPDDVFKGHITKIYPQKDERNQTFKVEAVFTQAPSVLYPGLSGEASIVIATRKEVLTIPKSYLIGANQVMTDDGLVTIETGLQNMDFIEVRSGISKDTYIHKPE